LRSGGRRFRERPQLEPSRKQRPTGNILVFAPLGSAVDDVIGLAGAKNFAGKIVIDTTNALDFSKGMPPGLFTGLADSLGEKIQRKLPHANAVKCFTTVPYSRMISPADQTSDSS